MGHRSSDIAPVAAAAGATQAAEIGNVTSHVLVTYYLLPIAYYAPSVTTVSVSVPALMRIRRALAAGQAKPNSSSSHQMLSSLRSCTKEVFKVQLALYYIYCVSTAAREKPLMLLTAYLRVDAPIYFERALRLPNPPNPPNPLIL
jgi:hypothetical protein